MHVVRMTVATALATGMLFVAPGDPAGACACGGIVSHDQDARVTGEQALIATHGGTETIVMRLDLESVADNAALIIPTPTPATATQAKPASAKVLKASLVMAHDIFDDGGQLQAQRQLVQGVLLDQVGPGSGQITFGQGTQTPIQQAGHRQVEHGVAQEFKTLIVISGKTAVGHRPLKQLRVRKCVLQLLLQGLKSRVHLVGLRAVFHDQISWPDEMNFTDIGKGDNDLVAVLSDVEVFARDRCDVVDGRRAVKRLLDFRHRVAGLGPVNGPLGRHIFNARGNHLGAHGQNRHDQRGHQHQRDEGHATL